MFYYLPLPSSSGEGSGDGAFLVLKRTASGELAQQAGGRHLLAGDVPEVGKELAQTACLGILDGPLRHLLQDGHHLLAYHAQLVEQGAVEGGIRQSLVGEYPLLLAGLYAGVALDGLHGGVATVLVVAQHAAQQSDVCRGDVVVVVELDGGEGGNVDAEFLLVGNLLG